VALIAGNQAADCCDGNNNPPVHVWQKSRGKPSIKGGRGGYTEIGYVGAQKELLHSLCHSV